LTSVVLKLDRGRLWGWHAALRDHLAAVPGVSVEIAVDASSGLARPLPSAVRQVFSLERLGGRVAHPAFAALDPQLLGAVPTGDPQRPSPQFIIDLASTTLPVVTQPATPPTPRTLIPLYDGQPGEDAMWAALLAGRQPHLAAYDSAADSAADVGGVIDIGQCAIETPHALQRAAASVVVRLIEGLAHVVTGRLTARENLTARGRTVASVGLGAAAIIVGRKLSANARRVTDRVRGAEQWSVAWASREAGSAWPSERLLGQGAQSTMHLDPRDYRLLPDDGRRYYADPFVFEHNGEVHLFVEELPYATNRGIISATTLPNDGAPPATPQPVLETAYHLSYPQVFARDGEIWMLPEQNQSGALILYRAKRFPDAWQPAATLIDEPLHDATVFDHGGRLWIAATHEGPVFDGSRWGSSWDALALYHAPHLLGPWTRHAGSPVLIDAATARAAGPMFHAADGTLMRPVQDCSTGYGMALGLARIDRLDDDSYAQTMIGRMAFADGRIAFADGSGNDGSGNDGSGNDGSGNDGGGIDGGGITGPHTLSRLGSRTKCIEAIDVFGRRNALAKAFRR